VTAFNQFAIKAFRLSATDYLLKPINILELKQSVKRLIKGNGTIPSLVARVKRIRSAFLGKIAIPTLNGNEFVELNDIIRIQADGSYSVVYFKERKQQLVSKNLKEFQKALEEESFLRVHKSHLVNLKYISEYTPLKNGGVLKMTDGSTVEIARTHKAALNSIFHKPEQ
jgi:two-component system, LytTR family, response regulator